MGKGGQAKRQGDPYVSKEAAAALSEAADQDAAPDHWVVVGNSKIALQSIALLKEKGGVGGEPPLAKM